MLGRNGSLSTTLPMLPQNQKVMSCQCEGGEPGVQENDREKEGGCHVAEKSVCEGRWA